MRKRLEETLTEALIEAKCAALPKEKQDNEGKSSVWAQAIVKVKKCDNTENYALAVNDGNDNPVIVKDFGSVATIVSVNAIHPYSFISQRAMPDLRKKSEILAFLTSYGYSQRKVESILSLRDGNGNDKTAEQKRADVASIKAMVYRVCINELVLRDKNKRHIEAIDNYGNEQEEKIAERAD